LALLRRQKALYKEVPPSSSEVGILPTLDESGRRIGVRVNTEGKVEGRSADLETAGH
jgi:hypothetical protein